MSATAVVSGPRAAGIVDPARCTAAYGPNDEGRCWWDGRKVPPSRTRWCSAGCEVAFDEAHLWPQAREAAVRRHAGRCEWCRSRQMIEVHHDPPVDPQDGYEPSCAHHPENLHVLCQRDHRAAHRNLRAKPGTQLHLFHAA